MTQPAITRGYFCPRCGAHGNRGPCSRDGTERVEVLPGSLLGMQVGNYVLVRLLGEGGMGSVYRAVQPEIGAEVAIKVLHATPQSHAAAVQRFMLEAQAVNRVRHPNLIRIIDTGYLSDRRPYLVMELLDGISLVEGVGRLGPALACHVACEALAALEAVHDEGVVHRDLKPANLFLGRDGRVVVLDFGIAKLVDAEGVAQTHSTGMIGTPEYMAPEQIRSRPLDRRTDVYAMGIVLYETITGHRPFAAAATFDMLVQHLERPPTSPRERVPELAPAISNAILRALEKEPAQRFQSAAEMATALRAAIGPAIGREELAAYVSARAPAPMPVPLETPGPVALPETVAGHGSARETRATVDERPKKKLPRWAFGVTATVLGLLGGFFVFHTSPNPPPPPPPTKTPVVITPIAADAAIAIPIDAPRPGVVAIATVPSSSTVLIDNVAVGTSPLSVELAPGRHVVRAKHPGYHEVHAQIIVDANEPQVVRIVLERRLDASPPPSTNKPSDNGIEDPFHGAKPNPYQ